MAWFAVRGIGCNPCTTDVHVGAAELSRREVHIHSRSNLLIFLALRGHESGQVVVIDHGNIAFARRHSADLVVCRPADIGAK